MLRRSWNDPSEAKETRWTGRIRPRNRLVLRVSVLRGTLCRPRNDPSGAKETRWTGRIRWSGNRAKRLDLALSVVAGASRNPSRQMAVLKLERFSIRMYLLAALQHRPSLKGEEEGRPTVWSHLSFVVYPRPIGSPMATSNGLEFQRRPTPVA